MPSLNSSTFCCDIAYSAQPGGFEGFVAIAKAFDPDHEAISERVDGADLDWSIDALSAGPGPALDQEHSALPRLNYVLDLDVVLEAFADRLEGLPTLVAAAVAAAHVQLTADGQEYINLRMEVPDGVVEVAPVERLDDIFAVS